MNIFVELDEKIHLFFNTELKNPFFDFILPLFSETLCLVLAVVIFFFFYALYLKKQGKFSFGKFITFPLFLAFTIGINNIISDIIKAIANRPRPYQSLESVNYMENGEWLTSIFDILPPDGGSSFLSSHASNSMVVATFFYLYFGRKFPAFFLLPFMVGWSRLYLGRHYLSDIIAGWILGFIVTYTLFRLLKINK